MQHHFMKHILLVCLSAALFAGCGPGTGKIPTAKDSAAMRDSIARLDPEKPHEVMKGKGGDYAFMPDTAIQSIILGNPDCIKAYYRENGSYQGVLSDGRRAVAYYNSSKEKKQEMEIRLVDNAKGEEVPYAIIVQWKDDKEEYAPELSVRSIPSSDFNFISSHGIHTGMSYQYVLATYKNQSFMEWEKGDTIYLQYKPKPKDRNYYKRYTPESYAVTYKFVDEVLCRMEYTVDPEEFEKK
jgi:hypothetical protein